MTIVTLEGNTNQEASRTGGQVARLRRSVDIVGYGTPLYTASSMIGQMVAEARKHLGYTEGGNNHTEFGVEYGMDHEPWCDIFQSVCGHRAFGTWSVVGKFAYTPSHANWFKRMKRWHSSPHVGDLAFIYSHDLGRIGHVALVESVVGARPAPHKPTKHHTSTLRWGSHGADVVDLQNILNAKGAKPRLKVDGAFGDLTKHEVEDFQGFPGSRDSRGRRLSVDGVVGPNTWWALEH